MAYVALKPCCFAGQRFKIGETIPGGLIHQGAANNLVKMQVIAEQGGAPAATTSAKATVVIHADEGDLPLELTSDGLQAVFDALTAKAADVEPIIERMTDGDALILLHITDNRKAVKAAAEARAKAISTEQ